MSTVQVLVVFLCGNYYSSELCNSVCSLLPLDYQRIVPVTMWPASASHAESVHLIPGEDLLLPGNTFSTAPFCSESSL